MPTLFSAMAASASALGAQRARIETAVSNMANAESTRGPNGEPYRRRDVVLAEDPVSAFDAMLGSNASASGVKVAAIVQEREPFKQRYEPSHPDADANGFVSMPNVDTPQEMVDMLGAARAYQANLAAITTIREMVAKALELGR